MTGREPALEAAPFFVLRTALLPFSEWLAFADGLTAAGAAADGEAAALAADRELARQRLRTLIARADLREALFIASPSLDDAIEIWLRAPDSERGVKAERSLVRYLARMCGRSTPFGLFAGCALGRVERGGTRLTLAARDRYRRHTRLDMDYLFALAETLARDPELRARLRYRPNSSLYRAAGRIRYVEARLADKLRSYHLVAVEPSDYLEATLAHARAGASLDDLTATLARSAEVDVGEAREFVDELVTQQLLVSDLEAPVTGPEPIHALLRRLEGHATAAPLAAARDALAAIDAQPLGVDSARYRDIAGGLATLPVPAELSRLFQVDLVTRGEALSLGDTVVREIERAVEIVHRLAERGDSLRRFREAFVDRYESAEVPLAEALDEESGIGFNRSNAPSADTSPLIDGLAFPQSPTSAEVSWGARQHFLLDKLMRATAAGQREIRLEEADLAQMSGSERPALPDSFAVIASLVAESTAALDEGRFLVHLTGVNGPSSANLLGRFCHGDPELEALVRAELRVEESRRPDAIFAEIVHLPEGRVGNVLLRPLLREWELPYLGASGAPADRQLALEDLTVTVVGDRVVMRSLRLGREIVPRLTTAHNYSNPRSLGLYRFLCMLQSQGVAGGLSWSWAPFEAAPFLPRVVCGRVVLEPARWRLSREQLQTIGAAKGDDRWRAVQRLRQAAALPRFVTLDEGDNKLPIDFDHVLSVETFAHLVKERPEAVLSEMATGTSELPVEGPEGRFVHELVVPFRRAAPSTTSTSTTTTTPSSAAIERRLAPGGQWLYLKLYAGAATVDQILRDVVAPVVQQARQSGALREWFFIRYGDPEWHLRVRVCGEPERLRGEVEPALRAAAAALVADGRIWRVQNDTYHREVERYGGPVGMRLCEQMFAADSDAALAIVEALAGDAGADARWRLVIRGIDLLLGDLGFDLDGKYAIMKDLRAAFAREHAVDVAFEKQLGDRFRKERASLEPLIDETFAPEHPLEPGFVILAARSAQQAPCAAELREAERAGRLTLSLAAIAGSLIHMHANRLLRASARANELVLYDFLLRLYEGRRARRKRKP